MNTSTLKSAPRTAVSELAKSALIAALYVAVTVMLSVISFGAIQLRLSEMFNYLALYHKRYVVAVTAGVVIANFMSPTWILDVPIGGIGTLLVLLLCRRVTRNIKSDVLKMVLTAIIFALSMFTVAGQLTILYGLPFWLTYFTVGVGELLSMTVGGIIMHSLHKKIDFTK
ncbi:QueT transporter family protein [Sporosarcina sp. G11-34]|uniref:QueT transporter family protein n=1 Tax=Sporosarcina sp. G11-34 TaxID=2849605 RepID=UPI0022A94951|nr:QueT transporter family protein [Sporosarcina sp. G11-34]MCZ2260798.1 QueT transporter family protein [Sporosarcina sp. G11-34]